MFNFWELIKSVKELRNKKVRRLLEGIFEFDTKWHAERNLYPVMVGDHMTRKQCIAFVKGQCCKRHKTDDMADFDCWFLHHMESCNIPFENADSCAYKLDLMFIMLEKGMRLE